MTASILLALVLALIAGVMNGSFPLLSKYSKSWGFAAIWLNYGLWGFSCSPGPRW